LIRSLHIEVFDYCNKALCLSHTKFDLYIIKVSYGKSSK